MILKVTGLIWNMNTALSRLFGKQGWSWSRIGAARLRNRRKSATPRRSTATPAPEFRAGKLAKGLYLPKK
jgi:hypothetical protein